MEMNKLLQNIESELTKIGEQGITSANLEVLAKLTDAYKDLKETESSKYGAYNASGNYENYRMPYRDDYNERGYNARHYSEDGYNAGGYNEYGRQYMNSREYNGRDNRIREHMNRIMDGAEQYEYGRERYQHGGSHERVMDGLEKLMYAVCMFVESTMEFAQSPQEKEVIRKHLHKMKNL